MSRDLVGVVCLPGRPFANLSGNDPLRPVAPRRTLVFSGLTYSVRVNLREVTPLRRQVFFLKDRGDWTNG
jgi:hypothetical protein